MNNSMQCWQSGSRKSNQRRNAIISIIRRVTFSVLVVQKEVMQILKNNSKHQKCSNKTKKTVNLRQQFFNHCATIIQTHWRGYLQKKRYRQFLPIYRRFRQLLFAGYQGWKLRRILKLQPIKNQINMIRDKNKNKQQSMCRIAKRQFAGQIERLSKRGRWIEGLTNNRFRKVLKLKQSKENSSLFGNIKSKSIRNVFNQQNSQKGLKENLKDPKNYHKNQERLEKDYQEEPLSHNVLHNNHYDQVELKPPKDFFQMLQQQCPINPTKNHKMQSLKVIIKKEKPQKKKQVNDQVKKSFNKSQQSTKLLKNEVILDDNSSKRASLMEQSYVQNYHTKDDKRNSRISQMTAKPAKQQKIKITLINQKQNCSSLLNKQQNSQTEQYFNTQSIEKNAFDFKELKLQSNISTLKQTYYSDYLQQKLSLQRKLQNSYGKNKFLQNLTYFQSKQQ